MSETTNTPIIVNVEPLNLRQREVLALESVAKTLKEILNRADWMFDYMRQR